MYLIGVDHSFVQSGRPHETQYLQGVDVNHFDPGYFAGQKWDLADLGSSEHHYKIARDEYKKDGREILDATVDGELNVFPHVSESVLHRANPQLDNSIEGFMQRHCSKGHKRSRLAKAA